MFKPGDRILLVDQRHRRVPNRREIWKILRGAYRTKRKEQKALARARRNGTLVDPSGEWIVHPVSS